jgi:hypothetical protein
VWLEGRKRGEEGCEGNEVKNKGDTYVPAEIDDGGGGQNDQGRRRHQQVPGEKKPGQWAFVAMGEAAGGHVSTFGWGGPGMII